MDARTLYEGPLSGFSSYGFEKVMSRLNNIQAMAFTPHSENGLAVKGVWFLPHHKVTIQYEENCSERNIKVQLFGDTRVFGDVEKIICDAANLSQILNS